MITMTGPCPKASSAANSKVNQNSWHDQFVKMLPAIRRHTRIAFRYLDAEAHEEAVQSAIAHACVAFARLVELDRAALAYAGPLAHYAVARVRNDRHVGGREKKGDVLSLLWQRKMGVRVQSLGCPGSGESGWQEILVEDRHATPADIAATRIDFQAWLSSLPARLREIAEVLATGEATKSVAQRFGVTPGRVSQIRRKLQRSWRLLQGEISTAQASAAYVQIDDMQ